MFDQYGTTEEQQQQQGPTSSSGFHEGFDPSDIFGNIFNSGIFGNKARGPFNPFGAASSVSLDVSVLFYFFAKVCRHC